MVLWSPELKSKGMYRFPRRSRYSPRTDGLFGADVRLFILYFSSTSSGVRFRVSTILDESLEGRYARWSLVLLFGPWG